jgi:hypothetical protein
MSDCACITGEVARREIGGSKTLLEAQVGDRVQHFAFPYGGPINMTEENRLIVRDAGFGYRLSSQWGTVRASDNPYELKRVPIDTWYGSPYDLRFVAIRKWMLGRAVTDEKAP